MLNSYATLEELKYDLSITGADQDNLLSQYLTDAKSYIDYELGYTLGDTGVTPVTKTYSGQAKRRIIIDPLLTMTQVLITYPQPKPPTVGTAPTDVTWDCVLMTNNQGFAIEIARNTDAFPVGILNVSVIGRFGRQLDTAPIPPIYSRLQRRLAAHWMKMSETQYADTMYNKQTGLVTYTKQVPKDVEELIMRLRPRTFRSRSRTSLNDNPTLYPLGNW